MNVNCLRSSAKVPQEVEYYYSSDFGDLSRTLVPTMSMSESISYSENKVMRRFVWIYLVNSFDDFAFGRLITWRSRRWIRLFICKSRIIFLYSSNIFFVERTFQMTWTGCWKYRTTLSNWAQRSRWKLCVGIKMLLLNNRLPIFFGIIRC